MAAHQAKCYIQILVSFQAWLSNVASLLFIDLIGNILSCVSDIDLMIVLSPPVYIGMQSVALCIKSV